MSHPYIYNRDQSALCLKKGIPHVYLCSTLCSIVELPLEHNALLTGTQPGSGGGYESKPIDSIKSTEALLGI